MSEYPQYRYVLTDLLTDQLLAVLPLSGVKFSRRLCRVGSLSGGFEAATPQLAAVGRLLYENAGRCALYVYRDGVIWWGGIVWTVTAGQGERGPVKVDLQAATFDSFAHRRLLHAIVAYNGSDQAHIMAALWAQVQRTTYTNIGVEVDYRPTGILRDRRYDYRETGYIGELIEQLGDVEDGCEHTIDVFEDSGGTRRKRVRIRQRIGVTQPRTVFQRAARGGGRVLSWSRTADATDGGTFFTARGDAPNGNVGQVTYPIFATATDYGALLAGWPTLETVQNFPGVSEAATLQQHANGMLVGAAPKVASYVVQVGNTGWSPNRIGDVVRIKLADDWHAGTDETVRPVAVEVEAAEKGRDERVTLILDDTED